MALRRRLSPGLPLSEVMLLGNNGLLEHFLVFWHQNCGVFLLFMNVLLN
jgi:hypothetical protein